jgi:membrane associated rhomboid family serine protease
MGIYDREYYRKETPSYLGSFTERGRICKYLIVVNVAFFILQLVTLPPREERFAIIDGQPALSNGPFTDALQLDADAVLHGQVWRLLTYAFLHSPASFMHILFNMLFLWWFGSDVEDLYGPREFVAIYLTAAVLGGLAFVLAWKMVPHQGAYCIGASGAVMAVLVLCAIHYPTRIIYLFFFLPVPIWLFVIFEVAQDAFGFLSGVPNGTAVSVHLAGAGFAFVYYHAHWRLMGAWTAVRNWQRQLFRPKLHVYQDEPRQPVPVAAPPSGDVDEQLEAKLDAVLEKVARYGKQSLSESENQILMRASEIYKRKRT